MNILITGATRGIGYAIAQELAAAGHKLGLVGKDAGNLTLASERLGAAVEFVACADLASPAAPEAIELAARAANFAPSVLILSAGIYHEELLLEATKEHIDEQFQVNLFSQIGIVQKFKEDLKLSHGRIIIIGSTAAFEAYSYGAVYSITKWALRGFAENVRAELRGHGVGVSLLHPGGTWTDLWKGVDLPRERLLEPSDVATMVAAMLRLSPQAVVDEIIIRPVEGDFHD